MISDQCKKIDKTYTHRKGGDKECSFIEERLFKLKNPGELIDKLTTNKKLNYFGQIQDKKHKYERKFSIAGITN